MYAVTCGCGCVPRLLWHFRGVDLVGVLVILEYFYIKGYKFTIVASEVPLSLSICQEMILGTLWILRFKDVQVQF